MNVWTSDLSPSISSWQFVIVLIIIIVGWYGCFATLNKINLGVISAFCLLLDSQNPLVIWAKPQNFFNLNPALA